jgi:hypothetical protein
MGLWLDTQSEKTPHHNNIEIKNNEMRETMQ